MPEILVLITFLILFSIIVGVAVAFLLEFAGIVMFTVPYLPVRRQLVNSLVITLKLTPTSVFYDLGSGDGRVVRAIARAHPQASCIGIELAPLPLLLTSVYSLFSPLPNAKFVAKDFRSFDLSNATHVFCYLLTDTMNQLLPKLKQELKPGTILISCDFKFKDKLPSAKSEVKVGNRSYTLYTYVF